MAAMDCSLKQRREVSHSSSCSARTTPPRRNTLLHKHPDLRCPQRTHPVHPALLAKGIDPGRGEDARPWQRLRGTTTNPPPWLMGGLNQLLTHLGINVQAPHKQVSHSGTEGPENRLRKPNLVEARGLEPLTC
jgi:hypothetical protein